MSRAQESQVQCYLAVSRLYSWRCWGAERRTFWVGWMLARLVLTGLRAELGRLWQRHFKDCLLKLEPGWAELSGSRT